MKLNIIIIIRLFIQVYILQNISFDLDNNVTYIRNATTGLTYFKIKKKK